MKIIVMNGSPKGDLSVTMRYVQYMREQFPDVEYQIFPITRQIRQIEQDAGRFGEIIDAVRAADAVLWAFPLYVYLVHSGYMRFLELIGERRTQDAFAGKYAAALSTSIRFFDNTAHSYMRAISEDLGMKYVNFFSAAMDDLLAESTRANLKLFAANFIRHIERKLPVQRLTAPMEDRARVYEPGPAGEKADNAGLKTLLITDENESDSNLQKMTSRLVSAFASPMEVIRLREARIKGGCLGCIHCGYDNMCVYDGSDDIRQIYEQKIGNADIIIFAGALKGRFLSARFKAFMDRRFFKTHQPQMAGKQIAYVISGPLGQNQNTVEVLQAITELDQANLAGIVTDECGSPELDARLDGLAGELVENARVKYVRPPTFLGVGGTKLFRDEIYGHLRFVFRMDHRYYKANGYYDFPQKQWKTRMTNAVMAVLMKIPNVRAQVQKEMARHMAEPFDKVLAKEL